MINNNKSFYEHESLFSLFNSLSRDLKRDRTIIEQFHCDNATVRKRAHCLMFSYSYMMFFSIQYLNKNVITLTLWIFLKAYKNGKCRSIFNRYISASVV